MLGVGVIDGDDGVSQHSFGGHAPQTDDSGSRLLRPPDDLLNERPAAGMNSADQVGSIVHGDLGFLVEGLIEVTVVCLVVFPFDGKYRNAEVSDHGRGRIVLSAQRVGSTERHFGPAELESFHQVGCLRGHVQAGRYSDAAQRFIPSETLFDGLEHGHEPGCPFDLEPPLGGQSQVPDIVIHIFLSAARRPGACGRPYRSFPR